ncbi:hypothetical protein SH661x_001550 [Planctomicrobium sp. SH661]|uniref:hypothetical protein n=1 Tax=Planctomicrobium sp. SH661 TaxID=3448124 RepID=UPI003F5C68B2
MLIFPRYFLTVFLLGCVVPLGCSGTAAVPQIGGVTGTASSNNQPLPEGTSLIFFVKGQDDNFLTTVQADGSFHYKPYTGIPVTPGMYQVVVTPPARAMVTKDGLSVPDPNGRRDYPEIPQKYRSKKTTPLEFELGRQTSELQIVLNK